MGKSLGGDDETGSGMDMDGLKSEKDLGVEDEAASTLKVATVNLPSNGAPINLNKLPLGGTEVKCDRCTKVFYNTEFLALHKLNKHGIGASPSAAALASKLPVQAAAAAAAAAGSAMNKENTGVRSRSVTSLSGVGGGGSASKPDSAPNANILHTESFCEYCNKSFCNKYFLRTHMSKAHGKTLIIENNSNNTIISTLLDGAPADPAAASSAISDEHLHNPNLCETYRGSKVVDRFG